ncbi:LacI family DNA-binding transcriptional regulator [Paenibacillus validus]|uniref:LacI family DNA-binding transcriptional regulator n=1 Tax=Paenibacillus validus TaxID=44253 RepID=A0A7X2Z9Y9_9BACL|nr:MULTISPECIES: LacI family DNA-binding transcriptional regulator [Paenibacillus]MED4600455.1 LacI family DNA-binding transcriptional regulator [Paenibacillus validus]MED4604715.1 LacI family DNA-binding transcriptional regulator [Paenibacillus validus]MUG71058.1 LacI family DNA-binding transcriptional regulator [Paenibacillus validus]
MSKKRQITIVDIAEAAGVSIATVSNVLNRRNVPMTPETIRKVEQTAEQLGYRRNVMAASLSRKKSYELGMLVPVFGGYHGQFAEEMQRMAHGYGYHLSVFSAAGFDPEIEKRHLDVLLQRRVDGLICHGLAMSQEATRHLVGEGTPLVLFNAWGWPNDIAVGAVNLDFVDGCDEAVRHLYEQGCRTIVYLAKTSLYATDLQRRAGFRNGLSKLPEPVPYDMIDSDEVETIDQALEQVERLWNREAPVGILGFDDVISLAFMSAVQRRGYRVPEDFRIAGINNDPVTTVCHPMLTSLDIPYALQAEMTMMLMLEALGDTRALKQSPADEARKLKRIGHEIQIPLRLIARRSSIAEALE